MIKSSALLEINTKNLLHNYKLISKIAKNSIVGATIKANAYGLGDKKIFNILHKNGCRNFFLATIEEAIKLKNIHKNTNIYVLNGVNIVDLNLCKRKKIIPIINSITELNKINKKYKIGVHIDSGINRLGIKINELNNRKYKNLNIFILLSHLASAEEKKNNYNEIQNNLFKKTFKYFQNIKYLSLANSMGTILGKEYHYDLLRPGISLYGGHYNTILKKLIKPVIKLKAKVLQIKNLRKNEFIGYNQTFKTKKRTKIAILGIGYADGVSRILSNKGKVYYKNEKFKILGRISMDTLTIDLSNYKKNIKIGTYMEIINYKHDIEKIAIDCNTISNEILTSISNRVKRIYI